MVATGESLKRSTTDRHCRGNSESLLQLEASLVQVMIKCSWFGGSLSSVLHRQTDAVFILSLDYKSITGRVTRRLEKNCQIFQKNCPKRCHVKKDQNIYNKAQFENPKHLHQTTFKTLKYLQQTMF